MGFKDNFGNLGILHGGVPNTTLQTSSPQLGWGSTHSDSQSLQTASPQLGYGSSHQNAQSLQTASPQLGWGSGHQNAQSLQTTGQHRRADDWYQQCRFSIVIDGIQAGMFSKCDGIEWSVDVIEYRDSLSPWTRKRRGQTSYGELKLTKGFTTSPVLWEWCEEVMQGKFGRRTGSITLLADDKEDVMSYDFFEAFPTKWSGFRFDAGSQGAMVEELSVAYEGVIRR